MSAIRGPESDLEAIKALGPDGIQALMESLRWHEDMAIWNYEGEYVWLKPCYVEGKRVGIEDCCLVAEP